MPELSGMELSYDVCDGSTTIYNLHTGNLKKEIPLTMQTLVKLMYGIITYFLSEFLDFTLFLKIIIFINKYL